MIIVSRLSRFKCLEKKAVSFRYKRETISLRLLEERALKYIAVTAGTDI